MTIGAAEAAIQRAVRAGSTAPKAIAHAFTAPVQRITTVPDSPTESVMTAEPTPRPPTTTQHEQLTAAEANASIDSDQDQSPAPAVVSGGSAGV